MATSIQHPDEPEANGMRTALDALVGRGQSTYTPSQAVVAKAEGCWLETVDGRRLVDFASGVLVTNLGHGHEGFETRLAQYRAGLPRSAYNFVTPVQVEASRRLIASAACPRLEKVLWAASGSEGIQKAMWCALHRRPGRPLMVATRAGFHGKKGLADDVTGETSANPDVRWLSFPCDEACTPEDIEAELEALAATWPDQIALLITEPYLGAAGSFHPPAWYHPLLQEWCNAHDIAFIFDEVQSCFGRTGAMYAFQKYGIAPDLLVLGKGLANGVPAAAVLGRADLIDALDYGEASDTFSAVPEACAAVCATLDVFEEEAIVDRAARMGELLGEKLCALGMELPCIEAIRGEGMVYGIAFHTPALAQEAVLRAYRGTGAQGVHFLGPLAQRVLRVSPPLTIDEALLDEALALLREVWQGLGAEG